MVQIWRKAGQYDPAKTARSSWIFRIARNLQVDRLRRRKLHEAELTAEADRPAEGTSDRKWLVAKPDAERLRLLVQELPPEQMEAMRLSFFEGLSHSKTSQRLGLPPGTVKTCLRLAFGKLRTAMGESQ